MKGGSGPSPGDREHGLLQRENSQGRLGGIRSWCRARKGDNVASIGRLYPEEYNITAAAGQRERERDSSSCRHRCSLEEPPAALAGNSTVLVRGALAPLKGPFTDNWCIHG